MVRIVFLGTAGSMTVVTKQLRSSGGMILQFEDLQFHLDPGPGSLNKAKEYGINPQHTTAVLVSHHHLNHCNDLNALIEAMTYSGLEQHGVVLASKSSLGMITPYHQSLVEKIIPLEKDHKVGIELVEITSFAVDHTDASAVGFKLFFPKTIVGYSGDASFTPDLVEQLCGSEVLILNVPYPGNKAEGKNLDTESAVKIISAVKPKLAIMTHFGMEMLKADPINEAREAQRITGVPTIAAKDGLVIQPSGYEARSPVKGY
ncbi:MBL fold metallo-hydrolase [Candidatus Woesearchaeota archaeon]|nr:MBL fold metallo-hydrolase [Candidatus Woesearchaeota archaeon]